MTTQLVGLMVGTTALQILLENCYDRYGRASVLMLESSAVKVAMLEGFWGDPWQHGSIQYFGIDFGRGPWEFP